MIRLDDFRIDYLEEARKCLRASNKITTRFPKDWPDHPEFWANLLGAIANSNIAAADPEVARGLLVRRERDMQRSNQIRDMLDKKLGKPG